MAYRSFYPHEERKEPDIIFSKSMKAGKRTYFFDVKATRNNQYYLTITESKKRMGQEGSATFEKHKIYLYGEDFDGFRETLQDVMRFVTENTPEPFYEHRHFEDEAEPTEEQF